MSPSASTLVQTLVIFPLEEACISQGSPEKQRRYIYIYVYIYICRYIKKEVYYERLAHMIMEAEPCHQESWWCSSNSNLKPEK